MRTAFSSVPIVLDLLQVFFHGLKYARASQCIRFFVTYPRFEHRRVSCLDVIDLLIYEAPRILISSYSSILIDCLTMD